MMKREPKNNRSVLPPLIEGWINQLLSPTTPEWQKANVASMLENVIRESSESLKTYYKKRKF